MLSAQDLRTQRQQHNQSQADLAKSIGVEEKVIAGYESGSAPIAPEHAERLQKVWHLSSVKAVAGKPAPSALPAARPMALSQPPIMDAPAKDTTAKGAVPAKVDAPVKPEGKPEAAPEAKPAGKAASERMPSAAQWLKDIAHEKPAKPEPKASNGTAHKETPRPATNSNGNGSTASATVASIPADHVIQAASQMVTDKQRRAALDTLLNAALGQVASVYSEDKQVNGTADAIDKLQPAHQQVIMALVEQLEAQSGSAKAPAAKGKATPQDQMLQSLKGQTPYETALNYLNAAIQLLKQSEVAERTALAARLQGLNDFDRGTVNMMTKRYQESRRQDAKSEDKDSKS